VGLPEQERALLSLVFDADVRADFRADPHGALQRLGLPASDHGDFLALSRFGLELDARDRQNLVLSRLARSFPLTTSAASALPDGIALVRRLIRPAHFDVSALERPARFGMELVDAFARWRELPAPERDFVSALARAEMALAQAVCAARVAAHEGRTSTSTSPTALDDDWETRPLAFAPFVAVARLPRSHQELTRMLVPCAPEALWARLAHAPLPRPRLEAVLAAQGEGCVVVARAVVVRACRTDAEVGQRTLELAGGFAFLLGGIDGKSSAHSLLRSLRDIGAPPAVLDGVHASLRRLVHEGMIRVGPLPGQVRSSTQGA
jgi:hypothetical protein